MINNIASWKNVNRIGKYFLQDEYDRTRMIKNWHENVDKIIVEIIFWRQIMSFAKQSVLKFAIICKILTLIWRNIKIIMIKQNRRLLQSHFLNIKLLKVSYLITIGSWLAYLDAYLQKRDLKKFL